jgi:hypothetical protein
VGDFSASFDNERDGYDKKVEKTPRVFKKLHPVDIDTQKDFNRKDSDDESVEEMDKASITLHNGSGCLESHRDPIDNDERDDEVLEFRTGNEIVDALIHKTSFGWFGNGIISHGQLTEKRG